MSIKEQFELSVQLVNGLAKTPTDAELLKLYGLFKQSKEGDCKTDEPSFLYVKERAKWNAWKECRGKKKDVAMSEYGDLALKMADKYGTKN